MGEGHDLIPEAEGVASLPVIDLSLGRDQVSRAILDAGKNIGFFQASKNILGYLLYHGFVRNLADQLSRK
jgi:hypothetical protein